MPQGPLGSEIYGRTPSLTTTPVSVDAGGNLNVNILSGSSVQPAGQQYVTVAASGNTALGVAGAVGDVIESLLIVPVTTAAGNVTVNDGNVAIKIFDTGTLSDLKPISLNGLNWTSVNSGWSVVTGGNVTVVAAGRFA